MCMRGSDTGATVLDWLVGDGELSQVMTAHLRCQPSHLDFNLVEGLAVVHADHGADHLRQDHHVPQVGLHHLGFLHRGRLLLGLAQALEEGLVFAAQATVQPPPLAGAVELHQLHVQKLVQVHTPVGELPEGTLLLDLGVRLHSAGINNRTVYKFRILAHSSAHKVLTMIRLLVYFCHSEVVLLQKPNVTKTHGMFFRILSSYDNPV
uniref:Uncharacterized protein n=1 Tax=Fundulus heteroclitus TaxID=8078 RepID=A0A3Q2U3X5_FUNHE